MELSSINECPNFRGKRAKIDPLRVGQVILAFYGLMEKMGGLSGMRSERMTAGFNALDMKVEFTRFGLKTSKHSETDRLTARFTIHTDLMHGRLHVRSEANSYAEVRYIEERMFEKKKEILEKADQKGYSNLVEMVIPINTEKEEQITIKGCDFDPAYSFLAFDVTKFPWNNIHGKTLEEVDADAFNEVLLHMKRRFNYAPIGIRPNTSA